LPRIDREKAELDGQGNRRMEERLEATTQRERGKKERERERERERRAAEARRRLSVPRLALRPAACARGRRACGPPLPVSSYDRARSRR
jgi:hypothetical protein